MKKKCGTGKSGMIRQKQLLTYLMKGMTSVSSRSHAQSDFHLQVVNARQNYLMGREKEDKMELPTETFNACFAVGKDFAK